MLRDETKTRLRRLTRLIHRPLVDGKAQRLNATQSVTENGVPSPVRPLTLKPPPGLAAATEVTNSAGRHLLLKRLVEDIWPDTASLVSRWSNAKPFDWSSGTTTSRDAGRVATRIAGLYAGFRDAFPERCLFLDLETCGFAGAMIFLAGVIHDVDGALTLSQLWARNYAEEKPLLRSLRNIIQQPTHLLTFNGKSFDWPQVRDRCVLHERHPDAQLPELTHLDLLHLARRRWKSQLPDCKLQTLEFHICGRRRYGDIPGRDIPDVYQHYVRSGDETQVRNILHHNALDLVTLLQLSLRVGTATP